MACCPGLLPVERPDELVELGCVNPQESERRLPHPLSRLLAVSRPDGTPNSGSAYLQRVLTAIDAMPGVRRATYHAVPIASGLVSQTAVTVPRFSGTADEKTAGQNRVGPWFAEALGLRLIAGRDLNAGDATSAPGGQRAVLASFLRGRQCSWQDLRRWPAGILDRGRCRGRTTVVIWVALANRTTRLEAFLARQSC